MLWPLPQACYAFSPFHFLYQTGSCHFNALNLSKSEMWILTFSSCYIKSISFSFYGLLKVCSQIPGVACLLNNTNSHEILDICIHTYIFVQRSVNLYYTHTHIHLQYDIYLIDFTECLVHCN